MKKEKESDGSDVDSDCDSETKRYGKNNDEDDLIREFGYGFCCFQYALIC